MIDLPDVVEASLSRHERSRDAAAGAHSALEGALTLQLRSVADRLLASILVRGGSIPVLTWWQQFLSREDTPSRFTPNHTDPAFRAYRQGIAQRIGNGEIRPLSLSELEAVSLRILGSTCRLVEEGRINRQLAMLGSSLRLIVLGSKRNRAQRARLFLERANGGGGTLDGRFIFGRIGPVSVFNGAALFVFEREWAISPYMEAGAEGFQSDARIVIRQVEIRARVEQLQEEQLHDRGGPVADLKRKAFQKEDGSYEDGEVMLQDLTQSVLIHESQHIADRGESISAGAHGIESWRDAIREDLLRFVQRPRTRAEIDTAFADFFPETGLTARVGRTTIGPPWAVPTLVHGFTLDRTLETLCSDGLLFTNDEGLYFSTLYGSGERWTT